MANLDLFYTFAPVILKNKQMRTTILPVLASILLMTSCSNNSNETEQIKTSFSNCEELKSYVKYYEYPHLATLWGPGEIGEPWNASGLAYDKQMMVVVVWNNVKLNGKSVKIWYVNASKYATTKNPLTFHGVQCEDF